MNIRESVETLLKDAKKRDFIQTVNLSINLTGIDMKNAKNRINEEIFLPNGKGRNAKVAIFATGELALKAKEVADLVLTDEDIEKFRDDKRRAKKIARAHDFFIAEAPLMAVIGKSLGAILGPSGKMPKPIAPGAEPKPVIDGLKKSVRVRSKSTLSLNIPVGREDMDVDKICENSSAALGKIESRLEKGRGNIKSVFLSLTMSPSVKVEEW
jgi:large subunit ribosomal protein L1